MTALQEQNLQACRPDIVNQVVPRPGKSGLQAMIAWNLFRSNPVTRSISIRWVPVTLSEADAMRIRIGFTFSIMFVFSNETAIP
jgi:hypothetical protein